jgi:pimeloyl-ACP methyl ester carboxylesterase
MAESPPHWVEPEEDGESRLAIDLIQGVSQPSRLWFFVHGLNSHRRGDKALYFAREIARRGEAYASLDLTGHGDSEGDLLGLCLSRNIRDLKRGLRYAEREAGPFSAVHLIGSSMGGFTAIWFSALNPRGIKANILIAPAFEMAGRFLLSLGPQKAQRWRREGTIHIESELAEFDLSYGFVEDEFHYPITSLIKSLKTPTLILHGSADKSVPCQLSRKFASSVDVAAFFEIEGGDHRLTDYKEELFEEMWKFVGPPQYVF